MIARAPRHGWNSRWFGKAAIRSFSTHHRTVGFIGLGQMGLPMALNLLAGGDAAAAAAGGPNATSNDATSSDATIQVVALDTDPEARRHAETHSQGRLHVVASISDLLHYIEPQHGPQQPLDTIITMLPDDAAVHAVMKDLHAHLLSLPTDALPLCLVDASTVSPTTSRYWHTHWHTQHAHCAHWDAPVSGGVAGAHAATLTFMVGGTESRRYETLVRPLLDRMGRNVVWCGSSGTGAATKLCNNVALAAQMVGVCEAVHLGEALGVDPHVLTNVLNVSTAACWSSHSLHHPHPAVAHATAPAAQDYTGGFASHLLLKDLTLALDAMAGTTAQKGITAGTTAFLPVTSTTRALYQTLVDKGQGAKDFSVVWAHLKGL